MTWSRRTAALRSLLNRLERNPLTADEQAALRATLDQMESDVEALGARVAAERADVDRLAQPLVRVALFVTGQLGAREAKEQGEYEAVLSRTMALGTRAKVLRDALDALGDPIRLTDALVREAFAGVREADLTRFPYPLRALRGRCATCDELTAIRALCDTELAALGLKPTSQGRRARHSGLVRIRGRLERSGFTPSSLPSEPDPAALEALRAELDAAIADRTTGLADAVREVVRTARFPALAP